MSQAFSQELNTLICLIYKAAFEESPWLNFLTQLRCLWQAEVASLLVEDNAHHQHRHLVKHVLTATPCSEQRLVQWIACDSLNAAGNNDPLIVDCRDIKETDMSVSDSAALCALNLQQIIGIDVHLIADIKIKIRLARKNGQPKFTDNDKQLLAGFVMHFQLAARFLDKITTKQIERNAFADAMNQLMLGVLILDANGQVVASNRVARDIIDEFAELSVINGSLRLSNPKHNAALYEALNNINRQHDTMYRTLAINSTQNSPIGLRIRPVRPEDAMANPLHSHAVVFLSDANQKQDISAQTLQDLFGFTGGEVRVAIHLANGFSIDETARELGISKNTAKSHVKSIYEKTGVKKQIKLIQLIARSVASVSN